VPRIHKTALVTGSGRQRVGYVVAKHLARLGYDIAIHYHESESAAIENSREIISMGVQSRPFRADVTNEAEVEKLVADVTKELGSLDVLVTTSSIWNAIEFEKVTADDVLRSFRVNTLGTWLCCRHAGMQMVSQADGGAIVTVGDSLIDHPYVDHAAYFIAKGSIPALTKACAVELASRNPNVRVNCIEPGPVMFPEDLSAEKRQAAVNSTLVKQANCPTAVAMAVELLISNPMLTGVTLPVDGGRNVGRENQARATPA
jgi:pteridine reductase